jgi:hypothetical protein
MKWIMYICASIQTFICFKLNFKIMRKTNWNHPDPAEDSGKH